jgi:iron complex outermembrane receptor protein
MIHHRRTAIATAAAAFVAVSLIPRVASAGVDDQPAQRVVVTGSNIKRLDAETADPVQVLTRVDISRTKAETLSELLESLPSTTGSLQDTGGDSTFAGGASSVSMRSLGKQSTLVLLNGRRVAPYALADFNEAFTNIDALPLDAIDRIEILKSGASAIYGSDAVAGVINIITRSDYRGVEAGLRGGESLTSHSFGERTFHASAGFGDLKTDRFNVIANLELHHRDSVMWRQVLDHMSARSRSLIPQGTGELTTYSFPGNIASKAVAGCPASHIVDGLCMDDWYATAQAQPAADRTNLLVSARFSLAPRVELFTEFLGASTRTVYKEQSVSLGASDSYSWADPNTGLIQSFNTFPLPPTNPLNTTGDNAELRYRFGDTNPQRDTSSDNFRLVAGLRSTGGVQDWETAVSLLGSSTSQIEHQRQFSKSGFSSVIGGTTDTSDPNSPIDPNYFNIPGGYRIGGPNSPQVLATLFPDFGSKGKLRQVAWDGKVSGDLGQLDAGPISYATGFDLRHEQWTITPSDNLLAGDIVSYGSSQTDAARSYGAVFGELDVPVATALDTQWAARVDKFPGFGAHVSPKVGIRLQPSKSVLLRGTMETGFRAPNLVESAPSRMVAFQNQIFDPQRCPQATAYANDLTAQANALPDSDPDKAVLISQAEQVANNNCAASLTTVTHDNPALKPEVSRTFTLGLMLEPYAGTTLSVDYWNIARKNEIGTLGAQEVVNQESALPPGVTLGRAPLTADRTFTTPELQQQYGVTVGQLTGMQVQFDNISRTRTSGFDISFKAHTALPFGQLETTLNGTVLERLQAYSSVKGGYGDNLAGRYGAPRLSAQIGEALTTGNFVNGLKLTYHSGTTLQGDFYDSAWSPTNCASSLQISPSECRLGHTILTDYFFSYSGIRNLTLGAYVGNLFNAMPPFDRRAMEEGGRSVPQLGEVTRRTLQLSVDYKFK